MTHDAAIIGGGVAGVSCALRLAQEGWRVTLFEANRSVPWKIGETLAPEARVALQILGLWEEFQDAGHLRSHGNVSAWGSDRLDERDFIFNPHGNAWQVDRIRFEQSLLHAAGRAGVCLLRGAMVDGVTRHADRWSIKTAAQPFTVTWLVDATGRRSWLARALGIKRITFDQLVAVYAVATSARGSDEDGRTFIESSPEGWWYSALMPGGRRTVSFQTDADLMPAREWRKAAWFRQKVASTRHLSEFLSRHDYVFKSAPRLTSAHSGRLEHFGGEGWLAVGDAVMCFDPLSGQGMLKAMHGGIEAARALMSRVGFGGSEDISGYHRVNATLWNQFLKRRTQYYRAEQRWPQKPFWERRILSE